ncbi:PAS domain-containing protein [Streptomyces hygroscopicus]|uniref:PAS domain-containing protein n=1 Tax=Streptomyces hygroscopicus TaxID=1912 RepID=UPI00223FA81E|nr:PAS domain-containing protein [Streptomyces hygroscopicus]
MEARQRQVALPPTMFPVPDSAAAVFWRNRTLSLFDRLPLPTAYCLADGTILRVNAAMAGEWGTLAEPLRGRSILDLFHPEAGGELRSVTEAIRLHRRSRYTVAVGWTAAAGVDRHGVMTVDLVSEGSTDAPNLLLMLRVDEDGPAPERRTTAPAAKADEIEARVLALAAAGATTGQIASAVGLSVDGVNYHFKQLSRRWGVTGKAALVARAYVEGVLASGVWPPAPARPGG